MSESPILAITEIAENQSNKYLTHNDAIAALEASCNDIYSNSSVGTGPVILTETEATRYFTYQVSGGSANFDLRFPSVINTNNAKRTFAVRNADTTYSVTIEATTGTGSVVTLAPGEAAVILQNYEDMTALSRALILPYDPALFLPGLQSDGATVFQLVAPRAFTLADDFAGSVGFCGVKPTSTAVVYVQMNGTGIGTISINTSGVFTFSTTGGGVSLAIGDVISLIAPSPADANLSDISITLKGTRVV